MHAARVTKTCQSGQLHFSSPRSYWASVVERHANVRGGAAVRSAAEVKDRDACFSRSFAPRRCNIITPPVARVPMKESDARVGNGFVMHDM